MQPSFSDVARKARHHAAWLVAAWLPRGKRQGQYWLACNPKRADKRMGSFRVNLQTGQWGDFAIGLTGGDLISLKAYLLGIGQHQACTLLATELGQSTLQSTLRPKPYNNKSRDYAAAIWAEALPLSPESSGLKYLHQRGLEVACPPKNLRLHPNLKERVTGHTFAALVAKVTSAQGELCGVHRTFLAPNGVKANVPDPKQILGQVAGGAVRLEEAGECLAVAEGIETALAVKEMFGIPTWATLSTSGMRRVELPKNICTVYVAVDYDANAAGEEAGMALIARLLREGRKAELLHPKRVVGKLPHGCKGLDWLDVLNLEETNHAA